MSKKIFNIKDKVLSRILFAPETPPTPPKPPTPPQPETPPTPPNQPIYSPEYVRQLEDQNTFNQNLENINENVQKSTNLRAKKLFVREYGNRIKGKLGDNLTQEIRKIRDELETSQDENFSVFFTPATPPETPPNSENDEDKPATYLENNFIESDSSIVRKRRIRSGY